MVKTTPNPKIILKTLNDSTLPGNILEIRAPVLVWIKVSDDPQRKEATKQRGNDSKK
jgi:hypothetical protein